MANAIVDALPASDMIAERPTLAGPGFINVKLNHGWIAERIHSMLVQASIPSHRCLHPQIQSAAACCPCPAMAILQGPQMVGHSDTACSALRSCI